MIKAKQIIFFLFFATICNSQTDTIWNYKKDKITIPFELLNNLILIKTEINNQHLTMILDTGSEKNIVFSFPNDIALETKNLEKKYINGFNSKVPIEAFLVKNNNFVCANFIDTKFDFLLIDASNLSFLSKIGKEINGIIGIHFFKNRIIEINYASKKIIIHKNKSILKTRKIKKYSKQKINIKQNKPFIELNSTILNNTLVLNLLIDTGLSDGLWLFSKDSAFIPQKNISDLLGIGLSGDINGKRARIQKIEIENFQFNQILVAFPDMQNLDTSITQNRNGSIGGEILKRFNWFIDYNQQIVYIKPNMYYKNPFNFNMSGIEVQQNGKDILQKPTKNSSIKTDINNYNSIVNDNFQYVYNYVLIPVFQISYIRENSTGQKANLKIGDKIISLNNIHYEKLTLQIINQIFQSKEGKKIKIVVEREKKILTKEFFLEKII